jgi:hypothetical protein
MIKDLYGDQVLINLLGQKEGEHLLSQAYLVINLLGQRLGQEHLVINVPEQKFSQEYLVINVLGRDSVRRIW